MNPLRTCVGCRNHAERHELLRVVAREHRCEIDERAVLPGRGAWVHPTVECLSHAVQRGAFARALRVSGKPDTTTLENRLKMLMDN